MSGTQLDYTLHISTDDGRLVLVDITDIINRAHFNSDASGDTRPVDISDAFSGLPDASLIHRIMLVTVSNPAGTGNNPNVTVDPEAARWLSLLPTTSAPTGERTP